MSAITLNTNQKDVMQRKLRHGELTDEQCRLILLEVERELTQYNEDGCELSKFERLLLQRVKGRLGRRPQTKEVKTT